jgi:hypothetical protein
MDLETLRKIYNLIEEEKERQADRIRSWEDRVKMTDQNYYRANGEICGLLTAMIIIGSEIQKIESRPGA